MIVIQVNITVFFLEKLDKEASFLRRFNKLRAELEVLRKQQRSIVRNGRFLSGILQYSKTLLNQAGMEVGGKASTSIIEQLQLPLSSLG